MGFTLPQLALFLLAFLIYIMRPSWLFLLWLISEPLLAPFIVLFSGVTDFEEQQMIVWGLWGLYNKLFLLIIIVEFVRGHRFIKSIKPLFLPVICLFIYFVIHNCLTYFYPTTIAKECLSVVYTILPLFLFLLNKKFWPNIKGVYIIVVIVCIVQVAFIPLNLEGIYAYSGRYQEVMKGATEALLMPGTFTRSNMMADYLATVYFFICLDFFSRKKTSLLHFIIVSLLFVIPLLFAGSKTPIFVILINLFLSVLFFYRDKLIPVLLVLVLLSGTIWIILSSGLIKTDSNDGLNRIIEQTSDYTKGKNRKDALDESTFGITSHLIQRYFWSSPIFGHGNAYDDNENAYPNIFSMDTSELKSDATLAFYLIEYGFLGVMLYLFLHFSIIKYSSFPVPRTYRRIIVFLIFVFFSLFALTERGLFNRGNFIFIFIYMFALARLNEEKKEYEVKKIII